MSDAAFPHDPWLDTLLRQSLAEDVGPGDASTDVTAADGVQGRGAFVAREDGVAAGLPLLAPLYALLDPAVAVVARVADGTAVAAGATVAEISGPVAPLLTGERTALNFLQQLGGIATLTSRYVAAVAGTRCRVLDTRKTLPGYRALAKYAVRCGGGDNHRMGLYDRIMLKDNHWAAGGGDIAGLVARARSRHPRLAVEVEVDSLEQLDAVLGLGVEWVLLDNFTVAEAAAAVARRDGCGATTRLEASGNIDLTTIGDFARAGVDAVSVGRLTHSAPAWDLGLDMERA